ncbi:unnamed protein product [Enterobius vermicularis]|uniref:Tropomodulin n=1 Tax=Enterobius vermicularis TaxID=51028 RepID=A0A158QAR2_ENTVE|nr:unnamed protein product [Enterobius vermicularis]
MNPIGSYSYYSEEQTISVPQAARPQNPGYKLYGKNLRDLDDVDFEGLLSKLSPEELEDLNSDFDPDNSMLPPSQRCRDQTTKAPTGPFQREKLLQYLEETAKKEEDWIEHVPFSPGTKRGKKVLKNLGRTIPKQPGEMEMPIELDVDDDDDEIGEALGKAHEKDLVDLAGILGMHNILSQTQYHNALLGKGQDEHSTFSGVIRASESKVLPEEPENETDVDDCIKRLESNDPDLKEVNINNMKRLSKERIKKLIKAACASKHIEKLSMANTAISDQEARGLVELVESSPSLRMLNIESNFISPELLAKLLRATLVTQNLIAFHAENQRASVLGNQIEMDMMLSVEENDSLLRVGVAFQSMEARHRVSEALERNYERRLKPDVI